MNGDQPAKRERKRIDRFIAGMIILGSITLVVSAWLAFSIKVETFVEIDRSGAITVEGPEQDFVGVLRAESADWSLVVRGLPDPDVVAEDSKAAHAICVARDDPDAQWDEPSAVLRAHLHSEPFDSFCKNFSRSEQS